MNLEHYQRVFTPDTYTLLQEATSDLSWLLSRDYTLTASLKLVGDRYRLSKTLREAVKRTACSSSSHQSRGAREVSANELKGSTVWIDGFNVLITVERALRGDPVLICRDGVARDIAGVHGTYRRGRNTIDAFDMLTNTLRDLEVAQVKWFFDRPVSNSGRVAECARGYGEAEVVNDPDQDLINAPSEVIVISGDGIILERCTRWYNLVVDVLMRLEGYTHHGMSYHTSDAVRQSETISHSVPWVIDLS